MTTEAIGHYLEQPLVSVNSMEAHQVDAIGAEAAKRMTTEVIERLLGGGVPNSR